MSNTFRSKPCDSPPVSALDSHLGYWLRAVSNHVSQAFKRKVEAHGVTVAEWVVLRALFDVDAIKPSELATTLGLTRGAISKLVDRLAAKELVSVRDDRSDGRAQWVRLRSKGRALVPTLAALADQNDDETFGHLSAEQRAALSETLALLVARLAIRGAPTE